MTDARGQPAVGKEIEAEATAHAESEDSIDTPVEIKPYSLQAQIIERLAVERQQGHAHNFVGPT